MPAKQAIQPAWRPIVSTTMIRRWLSAVVRSRSTASVTMLMAVSKPKEKSVTTGRCRSSWGCRPWAARSRCASGGDAQRVVAADGDQGVELRRRKFSDGAGQVGLGVLVGIGPRGAEDRTAPGDDAVGLGRAERRRHVLDQAVPALEDAHAGAALVAILLDDGADDGVQAGAIAAAGQQADLHGVSVSGN